MPCFLMARILRFASASIVAAICLPGCGPTIAEVSGKVTFRGEPVSCGSVILYCQDKQIVRGIIGSDGSYVIPNVPFGEARVTIRLHPQLQVGFPQNPNFPSSEDSPIMSADRRDGKTSAVLIPERYAVPEESGLTVRIRQGRMTYNIELTP